MGGPPRLLAVVAATLVAVSAAVLAEASAEASSSLSQVASARQQLGLDLLAASAAGYTDQDLGPILDQQRQLLDTTPPSGVADRAAFFKEQAADLSSLREQLSELEVHQLELLKRATATRLTQVDGELAQDSQLGIDGVDLDPIQAQVDQVRIVLGLARGPADYRRAFAALGGPIDVAQQLRAAHAADLAAVQAEAGRIRDVSAGSLDAIRAVGAAALADGRNYASAKAYLRVGAGRQYDLLEADDLRLQASTEPGDAALAAALLERHRDLLHAELIRAFPAKAIFVSVQAEELWAYDHGSLFVDTLVTTGMPQLPTDTGLMRIARKESPVHFISPFPKGSAYDYGTIDAKYALWFQPSGEAIHDSWWRSWYGPGSNLNGRGSHGCIGVPYGPIDALYPWGDVGTAVLVIPGDGTSVANQLAEKTYDDPWWGSGPPQ